MNAPDPHRAEALARGFDTREHSLATLSDNEQWVADNYDKTVHGAKPEKTGDATFAADEERILRSLGAALIMRWSTVPRKLQRELLDDARSMGGLSETAALRGEVARFLDTHKNDQDEAGQVSQ